MTMTLSTCVTKLYLSPFCSRSCSRFLSLSSSGGKADKKKKVVTVTVTSPRPLLSSQLTVTSTSIFGSVLKRCLHLSSSSSELKSRFKLTLERTSPETEKGPYYETEDDQNGDYYHEGSDGDRREGSYLKSHPYRKLCTWRSKSELAQVLLENQIHNDHGLFVTNKPFGVGVRNPKIGHRPSNQNQLHIRGLQISDYSLEDVLPELRFLLNKPELTLVKSTEKLTSGIAVFADDEAIGEKFAKCFVSSKEHYHTIYKYHLVTILPPIIRDPHSEYEKIGIVVKRPVGSDVGQPVVELEYSKNRVKKQAIKPIHVKTNLLKAGYNGGYLVEMNVSSVKNNFLRVHSADMLAPILGDHLYSSRVRIVHGIPTKIDYSHLEPGTQAQKLSDTMINLLELKRPEDTIMVPAHIHLRSYKVRKFLPIKTNEIEFEAPYPPYFKWTCEKLGISIYEEPF